jgi:hypothetical protein
MIDDIIPKIVEPDIKPIITPIPKYIDIINHAEGRFNNSRISDTGQPSRRRIIKPILAPNNALIQLK